LLGTQPMPPFQYISSVKLHSLLRQQKITAEEAYEVKKEDLVRYYNKKLMKHFRFHQWVNYS